ncbi:type II secretion system protein GspM [Endozoicomonas sp. ALB115]|uniref:type II secretion system protein GspM n=1 Tax=Endozoicomonas TaxID=305899 RepID=UPI003BB58CEC
MSQFSEKLTLLFAPVISGCRQLSVRDQRALIILFAALLSLSIYALLWSPVFDWSSTQKSDFHNQLAEYQWVQENAGQVKYSDQTVKNNEPIAIVAGKVAKESGIAFSKVQPGRQGLAIWLDEAVYKDLLTWIYALDTQYELSVSKLRVNRLQSPGIVKAFLQLETSGKSHGM